MFLFQKVAAYSETLKSSTALAILFKNFCGNGPVSSHLNSAEVSL